MGGSVQKIVDILEKTMKPKVKDAHDADQDNLDQLNKEHGKCFDAKDKALLAAAPWRKKYRKESKSHQKCRGNEAVRSTSKTSCLAEQKAKYQVKVLKCDFFAARSKEYGTTYNNQRIVAKTAKESPGSYILRMSQTVCGDHDHGPKGKKLLKGGWGGGLPNGFYDKYLRAKDACEVATKEYKDKVKECKEKISLYM